MPQNYAEAVKGYKKAAEQGQVDAQYNLGVMYALGMGGLRRGVGGIQAGRLRDCAARVSGVGRAG